MASRILLLCAVLSFMTGCAQQRPVEVPPTPVSAPVPNDPLYCAAQAECTTKVSRTLLFVFDYAAAGGQLVERRERLLFTPDEVAASDWPALRIRLAEPSNSQFEFSSECRISSCRYSGEQLLRVYRSYLADRPCSLLLDSAVQPATTEEAGPH